VEQKKIEAQKALIERVCLKTGLDTDGLANVIAVKPETMRKLRAGYQLAGEQTLKLIEQVEHLKSTRVKDAVRAQTINSKLEFVLQNGTSDEIAYLRDAVEFVYRQVLARGVESPRRKVRYGGGGEE
jgi:hypothetical protein